MIMWRYVQHHGPVEGLQWLLTRLAEGRGPIDLKVDGLTAEQATALEMLGLPSLTISPSAPTPWAGPSLMEVTLQAIERAVRSSEPWDYFINLSGTCVPLKSQRHIADKLEFLHAGGDRVFVYGFRVKAGIDYLEDSSTAYDVLHEARIPIHMTAAAAARSGPSVASPTSPVRQPAARLGLHCVEDGAGRALYVRGLTPGESKRRRAAFAGVDHYCGRAWYILHRSFCEWLADELSRDTQAAHIREEMARAFLPDESFLPTLIYGTDNPWRQRASRENHRLGEGRPLRLDEMPAADLLSSPQLFARKSRLSNVALRRFLDEGSSRDAGLKPA